MLLDNRRHVTLLLHFFTADVVSLCLSVWT